MIATGNHRIDRNPRPLLGRQYITTRRDYKNAFFLIGLGLLLVGRAVL